MGGCRLQAVAAAASSCWVSERDRPVSLCRSGPETHRASLTDLTLAGGGNKVTMVTITRSKNHFRRHVPVVSVMRGVICTPLFNLDVKMASFFLEFY